MLGYISIVLQGTVELDDTGTRIYPIVRIKQHRFEGKVTIHNNTHGACGSSSAADQI